MSQQIELFQVAEILTPDFLLKGIDYDPMFRLNLNGERYYFNKNGEIFANNTRACSYTTIGDSFLDDWKHNVGKEEANRIRDDRAHFGTIFQILCVSLLKQKEISEKYMLDTMFQHTAKSKYPETWVYENSYEMRKSLMSWAAFCLEKNVSLIAAELPVHLRKYMVAGTLDFLVEMDYGRGRRKVLLDVKSTTKGYKSPKWVLQLEMLRQGLAAQYSMVPDHIGNWTPKKWRETPTYALTIYKKNDPMLLTFPHVMGLANAAIFKGAGGYSPPGDRVHHVENLNPRRMISTLEKPTFEKVLVSEYITQFLLEWGTKQT